jgi:hypothetical protein
MLAVGTLMGIAGTDPQDVFCASLCIQDRSVLEQVCKFLNAWEADSGRLKHFNRVNGPPDQGFAPGRLR